MSQKGLFNRIKKAGACYPYKTEFWLEYVIICMDDTFKRGQKSGTIQIESSLHADSKSVSTVEIQKIDEIEQGKRPREYRVISSDDSLRGLLKKTLNKNLDKWDYLISFNTTGWNIIPNNRLLTIPIPSIAKIKATRTGMAQIDSLPLNKTMLVVPKTLKVNDTIPQSDNWGEFVVKKIISKSHIVAQFKGLKTLYDVKIRMR
jgi:hypothetical protein